MGGYVLLVVSLLLVVVSGVFLFLSLKKQRILKQLYQTRMHIASDLHDEIGATLSSISFYSEACLLSLQQNNLQATNELLNKIGDTSRETIDSMSDIVWVAHPKNDESEKLFQRLSNFGYEIFGHMATNFYFYTDPSIANLILPISIRKNLYLICKEALNNTAKYAKANNVELLIKKENKYIVVVVKDDGVGFDNINTTDGNGLLNMKVRAQQMSAKFSLLSTPQKGTSINMRIPLSP